MKFQKSMLKIYSFLVTNINSAFILEELIGRTGVGRTSGYNAVSWMHKNGLVSITVKGKQKEIRLNHDYSTLAFKVYLDSIRFKCMEEGTKQPVLDFIEHARQFGIKAVILDGQGLKLTVVAEGLDSKLLQAWEGNGQRLEIEVAQKPDAACLEKGICVYGFDSYLMMLSEIVKKGDAIE